MNVEDLIGAVRATDGDDPDLAAATQLRVRRSLETRARSRHQLAGLLTAAGILCGGTVSWALATGHVGALWAPAPAVDPIEAPVAPPPAPVKRGKPVVTARAPAVTPDPPPAPAPAPAIAAAPAAPLAPETAPPIARAPRVVHAAPAPAVAPVEALYRRAHELHFHGGDGEATLAAWDAYLAAEPAGRFSVEARYNRALTLVRLGRYRDAEAALAPFARGEVAPAGYRQSEAQQIVDRLARVVP